MVTSRHPNQPNGRSCGALALAGQLELLNKQLKGFDERIATVFARHPDAELFTSFPGAGPVIAANLLT
ncbi:MAG: hypothetical protein KatS3mg011_0710 [Acidimicrobiia bacterium]|nr:MAG: hypothetical protein KatS3mg011_0710 [Acidimicrobiia bacterium]